MSSRRVLSTGVVAFFSLGLVWAAFAPPAHAVWNVGGQFQVGRSLRTITPTANTTVDGTLVDPTCGTTGQQGGTSMAIVQSSKLLNVDSVHLAPVPVPPVLLVASCLSTTPATAARLNFLNPADTVNGGGKVIKAISTMISGVVAAPGNGWVHLVNRPDKGDLLGCGNDGTIYSIDYSQFNSTPDGTATLIPRPSGLPTNCAALGWDPQEKMIYQGFTGGTNSIGVHRFKDGTTTDLGNFNTPCTPSGVAISGGVLLVECAGESTILRLDKTTGTILGVNGTLGILGLPVGTKLSSGLGLGDLACDPVTFQKDTSVPPKDTFTDALWSRQGASGNGVVALEFPAFTCGLPSSSVVSDPVLGSLSPLAAGLSAPAALIGPGAIPLAACFDATGAVMNKAGDGLPDCWKTSGIDFDGDGTRDFVLCAFVNTNGDGVTLTQECADPNHKDLFVEIGWMAGQAGTTGFPFGFPAAKPDPLALSQSPTITSVQSIRAAFAAAPVGNPDGTTGIRIHLQVDPNPVTFFNLATPPQQVSSVSELVFTPCTPPAIDPTTGTPNVKSLSDAADYDAIKKSNFGAAEGLLGNVKAVNAKRLAFRYVLFSHNQTGTGGGGASSSGCSEVGGDDAAITLGSFNNGVGNTDQQAGTFMHEFGHTLGLRHGGDDNINCKPNYLSVMSYTRQFGGSPIPGRRLDYSRAKLPALTKGALNESLGLSDPILHTLDPSLGSIPPFFPAADQTSIGNDPTNRVASSWTVVTANAQPIEWNKASPTDTSMADINRGPGGCDGSGTLLTGHDDWGSLLYRASAALDFAGGARSVTAAEHTSITAEQEAALFAAADLDGNGVPDAQDCGTFPAGTTFFCTHRIDIKPANTTNTFVSLGQNANVKVSIFSEVSSTPLQVWSAPTVVITDATLTFSGAAGTVSVVINKNGQGTCSSQDVDGDGFKDLLCQFPTNGSLAVGTQFGVVTGFFINPNPPHDIREFRARQLVTVLP